MKMHEIFAPYFYTFAIRELHSHTGSGFGMRNNFNIRHREVVFTCCLLRCVNNVTPICKYLYPGVSAELPFKVIKGLDPAGCRQSSLLPATLRSTPKD